MVGQEDRLGGLEVRVSGHHDAGLPLRPLREGGHEVEGGVMQRGREALGREAAVGDGLVVARPPGVEPPARRADALGEHALDGHVHVLVHRGVEDERAGLDLVGNPGEPGADGVHVGLVEHALTAEHRGVGDGSGDVLAPQAPVERQRRPEELKLARGRGVEAA